MAKDKDMDRATPTPPPAAGQKRFVVENKAGGDGKPTVVEAADEKGAIEAYKAFWGIIDTPHPFKVGPAD